jgi:hypothetical protein
MAIMPIPARHSLHVLSARVRRSPTQAVGMTVDAAHITYRP